MIYYCRTRYAVGSLLPTRLVSLLHGYHRFTAFWLLPVPYRYGCTTPRYWFCHVFHPLPTSTYRTVRCGYHGLHTFALHIQHHLPYTRHRYAGLQLFLRLHTRLRLPRSHTTVRCALHGYARFVRACGWFVTVHAHTIFTHTVWLFIPDTIWFRTLPLHLPALLPLVLYATPQRPTRLRTAPPRYDHYRACHTSTVRSCGSAVGSRFRTGAVRSRISGWVTFCCCRLHAPLLRIVPTYTVGSTHTVTTAFCYVTPFICGLLYGWLPCWLRLRTLRLVARFAPLPHTVLTHFLPTARYARFARLRGLPLVRCRTTHTALPVGSHVCAHLVIAVTPCLPYGLFVTPVGSCGCWFFTHAFTFRSVPRLSLVWFVLCWFTFSAAHTVYRLRFYTRLRTRHTAHTRVATCYAPHAPAVGLLRLVVRTFLTHTATLLPAVTFICVLPRIYHGWFTLPYRTAYLRTVPLPTRSILPFLRSTGYAYLYLPRATFTLPRLYVLPLRLHMVHLCLPCYHCTCCGCAHAYGSHTLPVTHILLRFALPSFLPRSTFVLVPHRHTVYPIYHTRLLPVWLLPLLHYVHGYLYTLRFMVGCAHTSHTPRFSSHLGSPHTAQVTLPFAHLYTGSDFPLFWFTTHTRFTTRRTPATVALLPYTACLWLLIATVAVRCPVAVAYHTFYTCGLPRTFDTYTFHCGSRFAAVAWFAVYMRFCCLRSY